MKRIHDFDEAMGYVHRLGFTPEGTIHHQHVCLCELCRALERTAGGYPYSVRFHRHRSSTGVSFPWLGAFTISGQHGTARLDLGVAMR